MTRSLFARLLDNIAPRACVCCGCRLMLDESDLCSTCAYHLPLTDFAPDFTTNAMAQCFYGLLPVERCAAMVRHQSHAASATVVYRMKYGHDRLLCQRIGARMAQRLVGSGFFDGMDAIVPIPLTARRQRERGYNQSMEMARGVASQTSLPILDKAVHRTTFHGSQTRKDRLERHANVQNVFEATDAEALRGKHLLLLDDVMTTGATIMACAQPLCQIEGVRISVLTWAFAGC